MKEDGKTFSALGFVISSGSSNFGRLRSAGNFLLQRSKLKPSWGERLFSSRLSSLIRQTRSEKRTRHFFRLSKLCVKNRSISSRPLFILPKNNEHSASRMSYFFCLVGFLSHHSSADFWMKTTSGNSRFREAIFSPKKDLLIHPFEGKHIDISSFEADSSNQIRIPDNFEWVQKIKGEKEIEKQLSHQPSRIERRCFYNLS